MDGGYNHSHRWITPYFKIMSKLLEKSLDGAKKGWIGKWRFFYQNQQFSNTLGKFSFLAIYIIPKYMLGSFIMFYKLSDDANEISLYYLLLQVLQMSVFIKYWKHLLSQYSFQIVNAHCSYRHFNINGKT